MNRFRQQVYFAFYLFSLMLISGCATMDQIMEVADVQTPKVSIKNTKITALSMDSADLEFQLNIDNPNFLPLKLAGFDYQVIVNDATFAQGVQHNALHIAAQQSSNLSVPFSIKFSELFELAQSIKNQNEFDYTIKTSVLVDLPVLGKQRLPASFEGELPIPKLPKIDVSAFSVEQLNLAGAKLAIQLDIANPNAFGIDLKKLNYKLKVGGRQWLDTRLQETISLTKQGKQQITVPVNLSFIDMGTTLYQALAQSKPLDYTLDGGLTLDSQLPMLKNIKLPISQQGTITGR